MEDLTGKQVGRLQVIGPSQRKGFYVCRCECNKIKEIRATNLTSKNPTRSCGCYRSELARERGRRVIQQNSKKRLEIVSKYGVNYNSVLNPNPPSNNKTGCKGVCQISSKGVYEAYIGYQGKRFYLGTYKNLGDAVKARQNAEQKLYAPIIKELSEEVNESFPKWKERRRG